MSSRRPAKRKHPISARLSEALPKNSVRRVAVIFVILLALLLPFTMFNDGWPGWDVLTGATATVGAAGARVLGLHAAVEGNVIHLPSRSLRIDPQCTAVTLLVVYLALIFAYPVSTRMRILAIVIGVPFLMVANIARIVAVAVASELLTGRSFYMVHDYLFELAMVFVVMMMWAVWLSLARNNA